MDSGALLERLWEKLPKERRASYKEQSLALKEPVKRNNKAAKAKATGTPKRL